MYRVSNKSRIQLTVDPFVLKRFDRRVENRSERVENFMKKIAEIEEGKDQDLIDRKHELENEIEHLEHEIQKMKSKKATKESELKAVESALEQEEETQQLEQSAIEALEAEWRKFRRRTHDPDKATKRLATTEEFHMWLDKIDSDQEDLKQKVRQKAEEVSDE